MFCEPLVAILVSRGLSRKQRCAVPAGKPLRFRYLLKLQAHSKVGSPSRCVQKASIHMERAMYGEARNGIWGQIEVYIYICK